MASEDTAVPLAEELSEETKEETAAQEFASYYVIVDISATGEDQSQFSTKDTSEIIEVAWDIVEGAKLSSIVSGHRLVKPISTPVSAQCTSVTGLTWNSVKDAGSLKEAVEALEADVDKFLVAEKRPITFVCFQAWPLCTKLPREAQEKSIRLSRYLENPRYFELRREFVKYQEACGAEKYASNMVKHVTLSQAVQSLGVAIEEGGAVTARTAHETVEVVRRTLAKLREKAAELGLKNVLRSPFDMQAALDKFVEEASCVLFMKNLPLDVTLPEIESWYAQFGCKPVGFSMIKSPIPNTGNGNSLERESCMGFAVFATHEAAVDSLAMKGRVLDDRIVEVLPSSPSMLEVASEVLIEFPNSKNRPRPGDWTCPSCGFCNFQRRTECLRCNFSAANALQVQESIYRSAAGAQDRSSSHHSANHHQNGNSIPFRAGDWKCMNEACGYHNFAKNVTCLRCGSQRVQAAILTGHPHNPHHKNQDQQQARSFSSPYRQNSYQSNYTQYVSQLSSANNTPNMAPSVDTLSAQISGLNLNQPNGLYRLNNGSGYSFTE